MKPEDIKKIKDYDVYVDFGKGDVFYLNDVNIDDENKKIVFKGCQGQTNWIRIDALYPIKMKK